MPAMSVPMHVELLSELDTYLQANVEQVTDVITWWHECRAMYPHLSCMALNYLTIPGVSTQQFFLFNNFFYLIYF